MSEATEVKWRVSDRELDEWEADQSRSPALLLSPAEATLLIRAHRRSKAKVAESDSRIGVLTQERDATVLALDEARAKVAELEEELRKRSVNHPLLAQPRREP